MSHAFCAGCCCSVNLTPFEIIKQKLAFTDSRSNRVNPSDSVRYAYIYWIYTFKFPLIKPWKPSVREVCLRLISEPDTARIRVTSVTYRLSQLSRWITVFQPSNKARGCLKARKHKLFGSKDQRAPVMATHSAWCTKVVAGYTSLQSIVQRLIFLLMENTHTISVTTALETKNWSFGLLAEPPAF
jgi:hypothetical protein